MGNGGIENFVMNYYRNIDRSQVQFDFLVSVSEKGYFDDVIQTLGGIVHHAYPLKKNPIKNYKSIAAIIRDNHYQIVHRHTGSAFGYYELHAAKKGGAQHLILHAHNPDAGKKWLHYFCKVFLSLKCERLACSKTAGEFLFGKNKFDVIPNAINCEKYRFDDNERIKMRKELGVENQLVIGHIGRFEYQKNHQKLLSIFSEVLKINPNAALICVGDGYLKAGIIEDAKEKGILQNIHFLGVRNDVEKIIQAFDLFCLPSHYEGFGIVLIETQVNGLSCLVSADAIPQATNLSGNVYFKELNDSDEEWANELLALSTERDITAIDIIQAKGFDIITASSKLENYYISL